MAEIDVKALRELASKATPTQLAMVYRYDHGGGRLFQDDKERGLIADFYKEADREFYLAANPQAILALLDRLEAVEKENQELQSELDKVELDN